MILTNALTGTYVNRFSKKEGRAIQHRLDSLKLVNKYLEYEYQEEKILRRKIFLLDSLDIVKLKAVNENLQKITAKKEKLIARYKSIPISSVSLTKLDSAYEAEN